MSDEDENWGEWKDARTNYPKIGALIQIDCRKVLQHSLFGMPVISSESSRFVGSVKAVYPHGIIIDPNPSHGPWFAIRYRERKPRGLRILERILEEVEQTHPVREGEKL